MRELGRQKPHIFKDKKFGDWSAKFGGITVFGRKTPKIAYLDVVVLQNVYERA